MMDKTTTLDLIFNYVYFRFMQILESKNIHGITDEDEQLNGIIAVLEATSASMQNTLDYYEETFQE